jgi:hypothetical protein
MGDGVLPPFIAAERVDEGWARDELRLAHDSTVLSEDELLLDEELAPTLAAWNARNDVAWAAWEAEYEVDSVLDQARFPDSGRAVDADPPAFGDYYRRWLDDLDEIDASGTSPSGFVVPPDVGRYYFASSDIWQRLRAVELRHGEAESAAIARSIARDLIEHSVQRTKRGVL